MKFKEQVYRYLFWGLVIFVLIPIFLGTFRDNVFGFTRGEILSYYGVVITGIITMTALVITIRSNNKDRKKQFYFEAKQRHIINAENQIRDAILYFCSMDDRILHIFNDDILDKNLNDFKCDNIDTYFYLNFFKHFQKLSNIIRELKMKINCVYLYFPILIKNPESRKNYLNLVNESYQKTDSILREMYNDMYKLLNEFKIDEEDKVLETNSQNKLFRQKYNEFNDSIGKNYSNKINGIINNELVHIRNNFFTFFESLNQSYIDEIENKY